MSAFVFKISAFTLLSSYVFLLSGCSVGPDYRRPPVTVNQVWLEQHPQLKASPEENRHWWKAFGDPHLDRLIEVAYSQNLSLQLAGARVMEARAFRGVSAGQFFPQLQELNTGYTRTFTSRHFVPGNNNKIDQPIERLHWNSWNLGLNAAWELDFWGKFRRNIQSADANLLASIADYDAVLVTLIADVASSYVEIRSFQERLELARENVKLQEQTVNLTRVRFENGATSELDVEQAKGNLANTQRLIPALEDGMQQAQFRLCLLLGMPPTQLSNVLGTGAIPRPPAEVVLGIPGELVRRRPDVRAAEYKAAAQCARIGVAFAELLPSISFGGNIGFQANDTNDLIKDAAGTGSFGPSISWPILNYSRIRSNVRVQDARFEQQIIDYERVVLQAQAEAESAISGFIKGMEQGTYLTQSVAAAKRSNEIAGIQYKAGTIDFIRLLQSETFLVQQQDAYVSNLRDVTQNLILLYRSLGGGWELRQGHEFLPQEKLERMKQRTHWGNMIGKDYHNKTDMLWERPKQEGDGLLSPQPKAQLVEIKP